MRRYTIIIERAPANWSGYVHDLPACVATGKSPAEVAGKLTEAITLHIETLHEQGMPVPEPSDPPEIGSGIISVTVEVPE